MMVVRYNSVNVPEGKKRIMIKKKQTQLLLPLVFIDRHFPNYHKHRPLLRKGKNWKACTSELVRMKKALDKLSPRYDDAKNFGQVIKAKRMFKKAMQISKRISVLLGMDHDVKKA